MCRCWPPVGKPNGMGSIGRPGLGFQLRSDDTTPPASPPAGTVSDAAQTSNVQTLRGLHCQQTGRSIFLQISWEVIEASLALKAEGQRGAKTLTGNAFRINKAAGSGNGKHERAVTSLGVNRMHLTNRFSTWALVTLLACGMMTNLSLAKKPAGKGGGNGGGGGGGGGEEPPPAAPVTYSVQWMIPPAGMEYSSHDINDYGFVSGLIKSQQVDGQVYTGQIHAIVLTPDGSLTDLTLEAPLSEEYVHSIGRRINNRGVVAGGAYNSVTQQWHSYRYIPAGIIDGVEVPVSEVYPNSLPGPGLNEWGDLACILPSTGAIQVFPIDSDDYALDGGDGLINAIRINSFNDYGQVLYQDISDTCVRFTTGIGNIGFPDYTYAIMNQLGDLAAGKSAGGRWGAQVTYSDDVGETVFLEKDDKLPNDINDYGVVIGTASQVGFGEYVYFPGFGVWDVNNLVSDAKWQSASSVVLRAINNTGQIVGDARVNTESGMQREIFVLTPTMP